MLNSNSAHALEGGNAASAPDYPGLVILSYKGITDGFSSFSNCTGIVLEQQRILTTLDCVYGLSLSLGPSPLIPANEIHVHPVKNGQIGGGFIAAVTPQMLPNTVVSSYVIHPKSEIGSKFGPYNLAILYLSNAVNLPVSTLYGGTNKFIGQTATALGWNKELIASMPISRNYLFLNKLSFSIVDGDTNIDGLCFDDDMYTGTVFCGGLRNSTNYMEGHDEGAPIYQTVNEREVVIGILSNATFGLNTSGVFDYEKYARISSTREFIRQHAPNTQFWNERGSGIIDSVNIVPFLQQTLLNDD